MCRSRCGYGTRTPCALNRSQICEQHVALDVLHAVLRVADPEAQLQLQRAVAELDEQALRLRIRQHALVARAASSQSAMTCRKSDS